MRKTIYALALSSSLFAGFAQAAVIEFSGQLDVIDIDAGGAIYSGVTLGTAFSGNIDDPTGFGSISGGGITTNFTCCIAAGALEFTNDQVLDAEVAGNLNMLTGTNDFFVGQVIDTADLEGDTTTSSGGRIEIGLGFVFPSDTFDNEDLGNTLDPSAALLIAFFIFEEDASGFEDLYAGIGLVTAATVVPIPGAIWLLGSGLGFLALLRRKRRL